MKTSILAALLALGVLLPALGQSDGPAVARIIWYEGEGFEVRGRDGSPDVPDDPLGWPLHEGDTLITEDHTFVELELLPSRNVIKIAENTDFRLESAAGGKDSSFRMLYGSVRARVQKLGRDERFRIRGSSAIAGVRGTDFGMDVLFRQGGGTGGAVTQVYCFEGEVEVQAQPLEAPPPSAEEPSGGLPSAQTPPPVIVRADQMVTVLPGLEPGPAPQVVPLPADIRGYWQRHPFEGRLLSWAGGEEETAEEESLEVAPPVKREIDSAVARMRQKRRLTGGVLIGLGVLSGTAGLLALPAASDDPAFKDVDKLLFTGSGFFLAGGLLTLFTSGLVGAPAAR